MLLWDSNYFSLEKQAPSPVPSSSTALKNARKMVIGASLENGGSEKSYITNVSSSASVVAVNAAWSAIWPGEKCPEPFN